MAGFDALRGNGLARIQKILAELEREPLQLDRARRRFSNSPPLYASDPSGTTTRSVSLDPPSEEQRRRQQRRVQLGREREASLPREQFAAQVEEERRRIWNANPHTKWIGIGVGDTVFEEEARETIKKRWVEQGIWNNKWNQFASGRWKHEEPLKLEPRSETDSEAEFSAHIFSFSLKESHLKPRRPKSDEEKRQIMERRVVQEREHEASRPYHQFVYQISKERDRIQDASTSREGAGIGIADINTTAYQNVKNIWTKRGIWNRRWGILPGMSWKHEEPLEEEEAADNPALVQANPLVSGSHQAGEAPTSRTFGPPSPVDSNYLQASAGIDSAGLENGDADHSPSAPNSPRPRTGKRVLRPTTGQALPRSTKKPPRKYGQPQPVVIASLGPVHSSKVSKAGGKKKPNPQRELNIS